jgi:branched-chain amino acid transport system ATP-binding protein
VIAALQLESVNGGYPPLTVFRDVDFTVASNSTIGILGPNGAGKSTLLKTVAGLLPTLKGRILFNGKDVSAMRAHQRARAGLVLVPEGRQILSSLTVYQNLELSRATNRLNAGAYVRKLEEVLTIFPRLRERQHQSGGSLSGGEQQMLAIARAMMIDPVLLMLDEPTQGLAPIMVRQVLSVLQSLKSRLPMICVEQNRAFLDELADTIMTMQGGRLTTKAQAGT